MGHDYEIFRHHCVDYRGSYATNRWKTMKGEFVYRHLLYFEISSLDSSVKRFIAESTTAMLLIFSYSVETLALSGELVNPKDEKIGPQSFELLKVLGKGGYGKVRYNK